jgi:hypothetical protein
VLMILDVRPICKTVWSVTTCTSLRMLVETTSEVARDVTWRPKARGRPERSKASSPRRANITSGRSLGPNLASFWVSATDVRSVVARRKSRFKKRSGARRQNQSEYANKGAEDHPSGHFAHPNLSSCGGGRTCPAHLCQVHCAPAGPRHQIEKTEAKQGPSETRRGCA